MLDLSITELLIDRSTEDLDFKTLLEIMKASGIEFRNRKMRGPLGIATFYCIYLDIEHMRMACNRETIYFVILHEMAHYKRISRMGKEKLIEILSFEDLEIFCKHVITEEIIADRYACYVFQYLNGSSYPRRCTQQLHLEYQEEQYKYQLKKYFFGKINNEETYIAFWESFVINE